MAIDLEAYAARVGYTGDFRPALDTVRALHLAHATHIPFENIDVLHRRPISLDLESLSRKFIDERRGGYCFEQNTFFAGLLEQCGFRVTRLAARVRWGATGVRPRTHMLLGVDLDGETHLADVGFGGEGLLWPVPLRPGATARQFSWSYRVIQEGRLHVLQAGRPNGWLDLYSFTLEEQYPVDFQVANFYTSNFPKSVFTYTLLVQMPAPEVRTMLLNRKLIETTPEGVKETMLADDAAIQRTLSERFGLRFPEGTRIPFEEAVAVG